MQDVWTLKPKSAVWRTTIVISFVLVVSQYLSLAFFWWNLYLPEMRQHAHYVAVNLTLLRDAEQQALQNPQALAMHDWIQHATGIEVVRNPEEFPSLKDKPLAEFFTQELENQLRTELHEDIDVYFEFKPKPRLWIYIPSLKDVWVREPLLFFAQYNPFIIIAWIRCALDGNYGHYHFSSAVKQAIKTSRVSGVACRQRATFNDVGNATWAIGNSCRQCGFQSNDL